jgi:hypothetical protein
VPWTICPIPLLRGLMSSIRKVYLIIEVIWAECSLFACSLLFARWLFNSEEIDRPLAARFNSDSCNAFLLAFCLSSRIFNSDGLDWLGLEDKKISALWSESSPSELNIRLLKQKAKRKALHESEVNLASKGRSISALLNSHLAKRKEQEKRLHSAQITSIIK